MAGKSKKSRKRRHLLAYQTACSGRSVNVYPNQHYYAINIGLNKAPMIFTRKVELNNQAMIIPMQSNQGSVPKIVSNKLNTHLWYFGVGTNAPIGTLVIAIISQKQYLYCAIYCPALLNAKFPSLVVMVLFRDHQAKALLHPC